MQWYADYTGRRRPPCSGGLMTLDAGGFMQWWADYTGRRGMLPCSGGLTPERGGTYAVVG